MRTDKKPRKPLLQTPPGIAAWPWINEYDDRPIKGKPQKPAYKLPIIYDANNPAWLALKEKIDPEVEASFQLALKENPKKKKVITRAYPYSMQTDDDGEETGKVELKLKQNAFITRNGKEPELVTIPKFDAKGKPMSNALKVYSGSTVKASFSMRPYFMESTDKAGVSLDLKAVQVLDLVSSSARAASSYGFAAEEGYEGEDGSDDDGEKPSTEESNSPDEADPTRF